jgi:hypothetical protein
VKYLSENWGVNKDVAKIEEVNYSVGFTSGKFEPRSTKIYTFKNGKLISLETQYPKDKVIETLNTMPKENLQNFIFLRELIKQVKTFLLLFMTKTENFLEIKPSNPRFHWQYKYQYKSDGTPSVIEIFDDGKLSNRNIITSYQDEKNYTYTYENYSTSDGKKVFELKESL